MTKELTVKDKRLGKGLDALFGNPGLTDPFTAGPTATTTNVAISKIQLNPYQLRLYLLLLLILERHCNLLMITAFSTETSSHQIFCLRTRKMGSTYIWQILGWLKV